MHDIIRHIFVLFRHIFVNNTHQFRIAMLLLPDFNGNAAFSFIDPFRAANYIRGINIYEWQWLSMDGKPVLASNGNSVGVTGTISDSATFDMVVVNSSWAPERYRRVELKTWFVKCLRHGAMLAGIDTGAFVLARAGLMDGYRATVHYEHSGAFEELFPATSLEEVLYVIDRDRLSCCGGMAATDLALQLIQNHNGLELANASAVYLFKDRFRLGNEAQVKHDREPVGYTMPSKLRDAVILMERNLEEPLSPKEIANVLGLSQRQLQRIFQRNTGTTPIRYYINVRLDRARGLVTQTEMSIAQIATACGFGTAAQFSRAYAKHFQISPSRDRTEGRIPFQFRSYPAYIGV